MSSFLAGDLVLDNPIISFFSYNVNILTIQNFMYYTAGTLIGVRVESVKNPPAPGLTVAFEIQSKTAESISIDHKIDIPEVNIINSLPTGQIVFQSFFCSPWNGNPDDFDINTDEPIAAAFQVSFFLSTTIPKYGSIEIIFPLNIDYTFFTRYKYYDFSGPEPDPAANVRCDLLGAV